MCKNHDQLAFSIEESLDILEDHRHQYTSDCCPSTPAFAKRVATFDEIVGVYPVVRDRFIQLRDSIRQLVDRCRYDRHEGKMSYETVSFLKCTLLEKLSNDDLMSNTIPKNLFDQLKDEIKKDATQAYRLDPHDAPFQLIKKSSPKISNLLLSLAKFYQPDLDPAQNQVVKDYNDRGSNHSPDMEMVISIEPHRIAGMSAFGKFTSCQDWIRKERDHEYHNYTHQVWANLKDATLGIIYIRHTDREEGFEDMYARSLIRVLELDNGHKVLYIHRLYAIAPYDKYIQDSIEAWVKTLPENYHAILMYKDQPYNLADMKNKHGLSFSHKNNGMKRVTYKQRNLSVYGEETKECDCCDGSGHVESEYEAEVERDCYHCDGTGSLEDDEGEEYNCPDCNGDGYTVEYEWQTEEIDCENCDGTGYVTSDEAEYTPYNDHSNWLDLDCSDGIRFEVPLAIIHWDQEPEREKQKETMISSGPSGPFQVGDRVRVRQNLVVGQSYSHVTLLSRMATDKILTVTSVYKCMDMVDLSNGYGYTWIMLELVEQQQGEVV